MVRHCRVRGRHWRIEVARETDDRVELLTKFDSRPEETAMRVFAGGGGVRETDRLRPPAAAEQLLQAFVNKAQPEFDALTDRHQASGIDREADRHQIAVLLDQQTQPVAVQMHVLGEGFERLADRWLLANQQGEDPDVGQAAPLGQHQREVGPPRASRRVL